jgi:threonine dehydrogenase-like Zn-dependent dehydrogenase
MHPNGNPRRSARIRRAAVSAPRGWVAATQTEKAKKSWERTMKAVTWHGKRDVRVEEVPDPTIQEPTDAIVRITTTAICGSDLHLYEVLSPFMGEGDVLGHEPIGIVEEVGSRVDRLQPGDRVVMPFQIACGKCFMCEQGLQTQCETTQVRDEGMGAELFGYTKLYGEVPGGQAEYLRVPQAHYGPIKVPEGPPDERFLYLSDVLPTAWQAVEYAAVPKGGSLVVLGLGPIGDMCCRVAMETGIEKVIGVDLVAERLERARKRGTVALDLGSEDDVVETIREMTDGRGPDSVIDAVGMEAHGAKIGKLAQDLTGLLPDALAQRLMQKAGVDRLSAFQLAIEIVRRGGTISLIGVYGGMADPLPMMILFDKQVQLRMGQANVKRWVDEIMPLLTEEDRLGVDDFATHKVPLDQAPESYEMFQEKRDGAVKVLLKP